MKLCNLPPIRD